MVEVQALAVDPDGVQPTEAEEQPVDGYASETEADVPRATGAHVIDDGAENDEEPSLEETEALMDVAVEAVPGTAASAEAAPAAAVAALRADKGHETPPTTTQKKAETKTANEAKRAWVEAQWIDVWPPPPGHEGPTARRTPAFPSSHQSTVALERAPQASPIVATGPTGPEE